MADAFEISMMITLSSVSRLDVESGDRRAPARRLERAVRTRIVQQTREPAGAEAALPSRHSVAARKLTQRRFAEMAHLISFPERNDHTRSIDDSVASTCLRPIGAHD
jgi:hypothetical protein